MLDFLTWLVFAATGKLLITLWKIFPLPPKIPYWLDKLHSCGLCAGVWIFFILAAFLEADIISPYFGVDSTIVGEFATAAITSYLVHVYSAGYSALNEVIVINDG